MDNKLALTCAMLAQAAYQDKPNLKELEYRGRFENKGTDTQGFFGVLNGDTFVISFRGSEETGIADWITDLKVSQQVFPYEETGNKKVKVHFGFINAYKSVRDAVLAQVKQAPQKKVICAGHSLGGALATLCALDIKFNLPDKDVSCYTYGSPKVGNEEFVTSYNKRVPQTYRFVNGVDTIPEMPPAAYQHVGQPIKVGATKADWTDLKAKMEDHFPYRYIDAIKKSLK